MKKMLWLVLGAALAVAGCGGDDGTSPNAAPRITAGPAAAQATLYVTQSTIVSVTATDADGDDLTYEWSSDAGSFNGTGSLVVYQPADVTEQTVQTITVIVSDGNGGTVTGTMEVTVNPLALVGESYRVRLDSLSFANADCDGFLDTALEAYWNLQTNAAASVRPAGSYLSATTGMTAVITTDWSQADVMHDGTGAITVSGQLFDYDTSSGDDLIGAWNLTYNTDNISVGSFSVSGGNPGGEGCTVVLNFTIESLGEVYGTP